MQSNIRQDVIDSYSKLIQDCEVKIIKGIHVENNKLMIDEYNKVLNHVENKTEKEYQILTKKINEIYEYSSLIHDMLARIRPYRYDNLNKVAFNQTV